MHLLTLTRRVFNNAHLKIISLIIGYGFWLLLSQSHYTTMSYQVPMCVDNPSESHTYKHPETIQVSLTGKRADVRMLDVANLAVHIDGSKLPLGTSNLTISGETLFLPDWISLVHYYPATNEITVSVKK